MMDDIDAVSLVGEDHTRSGAVHGGSWIDSVRSRPDWPGAAFAADHLRGDDGAARSAPLRRAPAERQVMTWLVAAYVAGVCSMSGLCHLWELLR